MKGSSMSLVVYANGIQCIDSILLEYVSEKIVFVGNMRTLQNQDAVTYFVSDVFPYVKKAIPKAVFHIIGAEPPSFIRHMDDGENVVVSGFVNSIDDAIKDAAVAVAPVRIAAGIQNKVLISMACGLPVVLTSLIASAIPELESGRNCLIADDSKDIAKAVILLIKDIEYRNIIGKNAYMLMQRAYSWDKRLDGYEHLGVV
jgi:glycosyltransferase involved in cell wall biosynthesis